MMNKPWCRAALLAAIAGVFHTPYVLAIDWGQEYATRVKATQAVSPVGDSVFGDQINLFNGTVSFSATDISLPGNSALPVTLSRSLNPLDHSYGDSGTESPLGDWDIDAPYLAGTYPSQALWLPAARCSTVAAPPSYGTGSSNVSAVTFWGGVQLHAANGGGDLLKIVEDDKLVKPTFTDPVKWVTKDGWYFSCLQAPLASGEQSEGFVGHAPDGTQYFFNWMVVYEYPPIMRRDFSPGGAIQEDLSVDRKQVRLYATEVRDRFGNWVRYDWTGGRLNRIHANDGRQITLQYHADGRLLTAMVPLLPTEPNRIWTYQYLNPGVPVSRKLATVINPDTSKWTYAETRSIAAIHYPDNPATGKPTQDSPYFCWLSNAMEVVPATYTITSPSGAQALYTFLPTRHGRTNVKYQCNQYDDDIWNDFNRTPLTSDVQSLYSKRVTGTGLPTALYTYTYDGLGASYASHDPELDELTNPLPPPNYKYVTVNQPDGTKIVNKFGKDADLNEGQLFQVDVIKDNVVHKTTTHSYVTNEEAAVAAFPALMGHSLVAHSDPFSSASIRPTKLTTISLPLQGATFTTKVSTTCASGYCLDAWARPTSMVNSSTGLGASYSKTDTTIYKDFLSHWILGQVESAATNGTVSASTVYDPATALPLQTKAFGKLQQTMTYNADGTLATVSDGRDTSTFDTTIHLSSWKRGIPEQIKFATTEHPVVYQKAGVDDNGWIDWVTDENGYQTCYDQDSMGRITRVTPPSETTPSMCDSSEDRWNQTEMTFAPSPTPAYGLPAGHWRHRVSTGNGVTSTRFDALWRPVVTETFDAAFTDTTIAQVVTRYDANGRPTFVSYPQRSSNTAVTDTWANPGVAPNAQGTTTFYDALDRVTKIEQDDGQGVLRTTIQYLPGFKTKVTSPNGQTTGASTTTSYAAYGQPTTDWPMRIEHPEQAVTVVARDAFGKPTTLTRSGGGLSLTRTYAYDGYQQLCRTVEPETAATLMGYDAAGNLAWSAAGLPASTACDAEGDTTAILARKAGRTYDARNRLKTLAFPDGNGDQAWSYWRDGLPSQVSTWNVPEPNAEAKETRNLYVYNARRMLVDETLAQPAWYTYPTHYDYNANGHLSSQTYASGHTVSYLPNALGQPTRAVSGAQTYAIGVKYYPNGAIDEFAYGNGITHKMIQNERQLPRYVQMSGGVLDAEYRYDANGNVGFIGDWRPDSSGHRYLEYDDLDRLTAAGSAMFGGDHWHRFTYDTLDNLKSWKLGGVKDYAQYYYQAGSNRLTNIQNSAGASVAALGYDDQGNVTNKDGTHFAFDYGNRLREASYSTTMTERYRYDAHGRRVIASRITGPAGTTGVIFSQYARNGQLLYQENGRSGVNKAIDYIYLAGSLITEREVSLANGAVSLKYQHTDALGSPVAVTNNGGQVTRTDYEPYGKVIGSTPKDGPGYTGHVLDAATGMNYMQQRYFDPSVGRFLSVDPITANSGTGANFNRYWYGNNNPYRFTDPDGRSPLDDLAQEMEKSHLGDQPCRADKFCQNSLQSKGSGGSSDEVKTLDTVRVTAEAASTGLDATDVGLTTYGIFAPTRFGNWVEGDLATWKWMGASRRELLRARQIGRVANVVSFLTIGSSLVDLNSSAMNGDSLGALDAGVDLGFGVFGTTGVGAPGAATYGATSLLLEVPAVHDAVITPMVDWACRRTGDC